MLKNMNPRLPLAVTLFSVVMAGCGGGGGGAAAPIANTPVVPASVTTYVTGVITGFGSIIINGVRYESDSATVSKEGKTATVADLKTGEVVQIRVEKDSAGVNHAKAVEQSRLAQGAVEAVDLAANTLTIAGQTILVTVDTIFDPAIAGGALAGIAVGDIIEVHGFASSTGAPQATRIEKADPADTEIEVTGKCQALHDWHAGGGLRHCYARGSGEQRPGRWRLGRSQRHDAVGRRCVAGRSRQERRWRDARAEG